MDGWISLHRKIRKNPIFNDHQLLRLWLICLTEAYFKPCNLLIGKQEVYIDKGQFPTGRFELHRMYNDGLSAKEVVSEKTVWRWLEKLEKLDFLTINSTNKYSIVALVNWDKYQNNDQQDDQQMTNKRPTDDQQMTTKNKDNNDNNKKILHGDHVLLTDAQHEKLIKDLSEPVVEKLIDDINYWFTQKPERKKNYKDHNLMIRKWKKLNDERMRTLPGNKEAEHQKRQAEERKAGLFEFSFQPDEILSKAVGDDG